MTNTHADKLLEHTRTCYKCLSAKVANKPNHCAQGRELIQATLKERHGDKRGA